MLRGVKRVLAFLKIFRFDPGSSIKVLSHKIEKNVSFKYGAILPQHDMPSPVPSEIDGVVLERPLCTQ